MLASKIVVISHGSNDFGLYWFMIRHKLVLNVWHGIGIKQVGILDNSMTRGSAVRYLENETRYYDLVTVSSSAFKYLFSASHGVDVRKIHVTGDPRVDKYIENRKLNYIKDSKFRVLYAPTFRDYKIEKHIFFPFSDYSDEKLKIYFKNNPNIYIYLRPHPNDLVSINYARKLKDIFQPNIKLFDNSVCDDLDSEIHRFDAIISDYSSVHFEPLLADVPCIFVPFDIDMYIQKRGFAFPYDLVTPGPKVESNDELLEAISKATLRAKGEASKVEFVKSLFFHYQNGGSLNRIEEVIEKYSKISG